MAAGGFTFDLLNRLYNFHWVARETCARSAQPYLGQWRRFLVRNGIAAILNLRGRHPHWRWWQTETRVAADLGIRHYDLALNSRRLPPSDLLTKMIACFDVAPRPLLIKCSGGQDRTSFVSALFLLHAYGWDAFDRAQAQFASFPYLHFPKTNQRWLRLFLDFARQDADGASLAVWIRDRYDPQRLADWLEETGYRSSYEKLMLG